MGHGLLLWGVGYSMWPLLQASVQPENASYTSLPLGGAANADEPRGFKRGYTHTHTHNHMKIMVILSLYEETQ